MWPWRWAPPALREGAPGEETYYLAKDRLVMLRGDYEVLEEDACRHRPRRRPLPPASFPRALDLGVAHWEDGPTSWPKPTS